MLWLPLPAGEYLDAEFDEPDAMADRELCCAIVAGKAGLHPDAWGNHDPLTILPQRYRKPWVPPIGLPADHAVEWREHKPKPPKPRPEPVQRQLTRPERRAMAAAWEPPPPKDGALQLTCDVCARVRFGIVNYYGDRSVKVAEIRALGHIEGWTCIADTDRCPKCSQAAAPEPVGNGTSEGEGDE